MKLLLTSTLLLLLLPSVFSQNIGVNTTGANPDATAMLDIVSSNKGLLIPRVNIANLSTDAPIASATTSLLVYNTNAASGVGYYYWDGSKWNRLYDETVNSEDHDWYEVGGTNPPNAIADNIFTNGKVGIAVPNPSAVLDMVGDIAINRSQLGGGARPWMSDGIRIGAGGSDNAYFGLKDEGVNNADAVIAWGDDAGDHLRFINTRSGGPVDGVEYMRIEDGGDVGIGTSNPSSILHVADNVPVIKIQDNNNEDTDNAFAGWVGGYDQSGDEIWWLGEGSSSGKALGFYSNRNYDMNLFNNGDGITIKTTGAVGIGETNPTEKLEIAGNVEMNSYALGVQNGLYFRNGFNSSSNPYNLSITTDNFSGDGTPDALSINGFEGVSISTGHNTILQRRMTIINNGNIGMHLINPSEKLHVNGRVRIDDQSSSTYIGRYDMGCCGGSQIPAGDFRGVNVLWNTDAAMFGLRDYGADRKDVVINNEQTSDNIRFQAGGEDKMIVLGGGNVGIGNTAPSQKLHVTGNILASGSITSSDVRYKKNIQSIENATVLLSKINPVSYKYRSDEFAEGQFDDNKHFGVIAQELEAILPNMVYTDNEGFKAVNYIDFISVLIQSNQEQEAKILQLQKDLLELKLILKK